MTKDNKFAQKAPFIFIALFLFIFIAIAFFLPAFYSITENYYYFYYYFICCCYRKITTSDKRLVCLRFLCLSYLTV